MVDFQTFQTTCILLNAASFFLLCLLPPYFVQPPHVGSDHLAPAHSVNSLCVIYLWALAKTIFKSIEHAFKASRSVTHCMLLICVVSGISAVTPVCAWPILLCFIACRAMANALSHLLPPEKALAVAQRYQSLGGLMTAYAAQSTWVWMLVWKDSCG
jgi:hypothetical protein